MSSPKPRALQSSRRSGLQRRPRSIDTYDGAEPSDGASTRRNDHPAGDLTGLRVGYVTGVAPAGADDRGFALWVVHCDCGRDFVAPVSSLRGGWIRSCGCMPISRRSTP